MSKPNRWTPHHDPPLTKTKRSQHRVLMIFLVLPSHPAGTLRAGHDTPGADEVVGVAGEQGLAVSGPGEGDTLGLAGLLADSGGLGLELVDLALLLEVEDDDARGGGSAEPVAVGGEDQGVNLVTGVQGVQVLGLVQVPEHGGSVLATGGAERAIGGDGDGVDVAGVADVVGLELAGGELPNLRMVSKLSYPMSFLPTHRFSSGRIGCGVLNQGNW